MSISYNYMDADKDEPDQFLEFNDWESIKPALVALKAKSGVEIDPYSDTRFSDDHAVLLSQLIERLVKGPSIGVSNLSQILSESGKTGRWLLFVGD
ncbi:hypothetical protein [Parasphingorhabdus sp.]|uniref:hypothetical protein n=1 Tax=Parasphingorhabdus sp. TaxID=2709688 RepID=UPI003BB1E3AB